MDELVSVIICHHKGDLVLNAIESLKKSLEVKFEIIVVTSTDRLFDCQTIYCEGGPAHKRNVGVRASKGKYVAFFDDDIEAEPYALFYMLEELKKDSIGMVYGKLLNMEFRDHFDEAGSFLTSIGFLWARAGAESVDSGQFDELSFVLAGKSASCMVHKKVFLEAGGFDSSFEILGEETDLSWRIWLYGYQVLFVPRSVTFHAFNTKFKPADFYIPRRVYYNGCRNYISMLLANLENKNLPIPITVQFVVWTASAFGMILTGKFEAGFWIFKGMWYVLTHLDKILTKRAVIQANRRVSDKELLPIIRRNPPLSYYWKRFFHYIATGRHG